MKLDGKKVVVTGGSRGPASRTIPLSASLQTSPIGELVIPKSSSTPLVRSGLPKRAKLGQLKRRAGPSRAGRAGRSDDCFGRKPR